MSTSLIDSANTGLLIRAFVFAACLSEAASLAAAAHATTTLPPLPDIAVFAEAIANDDNGPEANGGVRFSSAFAEGRFRGNLNVAQAQVSGVNLSEVVGGVAPVGRVSAGALTGGDFTGSIDAFANATLNYWFRDTETAPFPKNLLGLPITLKFKGVVFGFRMGVGQLWLLPPDGTPLGGNVLLSSPAQGGTLTNTITLDASPNQVFQVVELAKANADCVTDHPHCLPSRAFVDPLITFDQQSFDALAAARGVPSVPLDEFFRIDFSPGLDRLPPFGAVPEPSTWVLLIAGGGLIGLRMLGRGRVASARHARIRREAHGQVQASVGRGV
jgi:hypothetical protein